MLDAKTERALTDIVQQLRGLFDTRLACVALYGSAVGPDFVPGVSDLNLAIVLDAVAASDLNAMRPAMKRWRSHRVATPLVLDRVFLRDAADVFPMELEDIRDQHRPLFGDDVFAALAIRRDHLRYQCEHEARGKLLRLTGLYLEQGDRRHALRALMLDSLKTFLVVMRNINRLVGVHAVGAGYRDTLRAAAQHFGVEFPLMTQLLDIKAGRTPWPADDTQTFRGYLDEVQRLVGLIDRLPAGSTTVGS
jgi:hypothetical protein